MSFYTRAELESPLKKDIDLTQGLQQSCCKSVPDLPQTSCNKDISSEGLAPDGIVNDTYLHKGPGV